MQETTNYNLSKPELTDSVGVSIPAYAENADIIDAALKDLEDTKVDKVEGKGLSTNDYDAAAVAEVAKVVNKVDKEEGKDLFSTTNAAALTGGEETTLHKHKAADVNIADGTVEEVIQGVESDLSSHALKIATVDKSLNDLADTLSQVNINQEAKQTSSGIGTVSLPKNAANGHMGYKVNGLTASNIITNGNFANGTTGWSIAGGTHSVANNTMVSVGNGVQGYINEYQGISNASQYQNHKVYVKARVRVTNSACLSLKLIVQTNIGNLPVVQKSSPVQDQWYPLSGIATVQDSATAVNISIQSQYADATTANGKVMEVQEVTANDLTATFGSGNEPDVATCDKLFANWFDGTKSTTSARRIRSVGKNLFDKTDVVANYTINSTGGLTASTLANASNYIKVLPNTQYYLSGKTGSTYIAYYDINKTFISSMSGQSIGLTTPVNAYYIRFGVMYEVMDTCMLELGTTATTYEPYKESSLYISDAGVLRSVPNGVADTIEDGVKTQNVSEEISLSGTDFASIYKSYTNYDYIVTTAFTLAKPGVNGVIDGITRLYDKNGVELDEIASVAGNDIAKVGKYTYDANNQLLIIVQKGLYANIADARVGLGTMKVQYQLATPIESPVQTSGTLLSYPSGTVYYEKAIADAGIYDNGITVLNPNYPIATLEKIVKIDFVTGVETEINVSTAVVAGDGLSFTHPDLTADDIVFFTYFYANESTEGEMTLSYYDSRYTITDTANEKFYQWKISSTNGVASIALVEV